MTDPFDPTPDEDALLAVSALLDGTASAEDVARVESDPALRALLDDLRVLRAEVADVPPPPAATRDAAIAGALAVFDEVHAPTTTDTVAAHTSPTGSTPPAANVVRFERRRRWYGVVTGAAAAAVAVLFVGALVSGGLGGGDDEESTAFESPAADEARTAPAETLAGATEAPPAMGAEPMMTETGELDAATEAPDGADQAGGADVEMADTTEPPAAAEATVAPAATNAATDDTIDSIDGAAEVVAITSPEQLRDYANGRRAVLPLPGLGFPCVEEGQEAIGEVTYQGVQSIVVRDPSTGTVTAYDLRGSCAVVATVEP